jgi:hypothetical protein
MNPIPRRTTNPIDRRNGKADGSRNTLKRIKSAAITEATRENLKINAPKVPNKATLKRNCQIGTPNVPDKIWNRPSSGVRAAAIMVIDARPPRTFGYYNLQRTKRHPPLICYSISTDVMRF